MTVNQPTITSLFQTSLREWQAQFKANREAAGSVSRSLRAARVIRRRSSTARRPIGQNAEE
jgi:hypothetical protein